MSDRTEPISQLGESFKAAMAAVRRLRGRETHRPGELSYAQLGLLGALSKGGALSARELALAADLSPATVTEMLDSLALAGLVTRVRSERDKRIVLTSLTERGARLVAERFSHWESRWRAALEGFSDEELLTAASVLDELTAMLDAELEADTPPVAAESVAAG
jgi:DNA-binding MarR family transcriptional regulator